jgi:dihydroflavonol-4-reductase
MKILCVNNFYSNLKATRDLGIQFQPVDMGIREAVEWFRKMGMIKSPKKTKFVS